MRVAGAGFKALLLVILASVLPAWEAHAAGDWTWPVEGEVLSSYRNGDDPYAAGQHRGIDIGAPAGQVVRATTAGTVTFAGGAGSSGLTVAVRTADDRYDTSYLHLESISVREGDRVAPGGELGTVGTTGRRSTQEPHVHFGVRDAGERHAYRDPLLFLAPPGTPLEAPPPAPIATPVRRERPPLDAPSPAARPHPVAVPKGGPAPAPLPAPSAAPAPAPLPAPAPAGRRGRAPAPEPQPAGAPAPARSPAPARGARAMPEPGRGPVSLGASPEARRTAVAVEPDGLHLGWALACLGAVIAATALARPSGARRVARHARGVVGLALRPLTGRY